MSEEKKRKNKIMAIVVGICAAIILGATSTYAYWQITRSQKDPNQIVAACLDFDVNFPVGITEENKWPMSGTEAMSTIDGYTFTITNNCPEDVTYVIGLESVTSDGITDYLQDSSVGIGFDGVNKGTYASLTDLEGPTANARGSKKLQTAIVKGKSDVEGENVNTHNLKLWIDESSDVEEQSKGFSGKLFITGGQKVENDMPNPLTAEACFEMDTETGTEIIGYDESCGESVVIPATVNNVAVKTIDTIAFKNVEYNYDYGIVVENSQPVAGIIYNMEEFDNLMAWAERNNMSHLTFYEVEEPELQEGQKIQYCEEPVDGSMPKCYDKEDLNLTNETVKITGLDLSYASNLELIEPRAFSNYDCSDDGKEEIAEAIKNTKVSLTSLKFGKSINELTIGYGAFSVIDVDELTIYSNIISMKLLTETYQNLFTYGFFMGSNIEKLNIEYVDGYESIGIIGDTLDTIRGSLFEGINSDVVKIGEGIKELKSSVFSENEYSTQNINTIILPTTINYLGDNSLEVVDNVIFSANTCEGVKIDSNAWKDTAVVTPNTCILGQNID